MKISKLGSHLQACILEIAIRTWGIFVYLSLLRNVRFLFCLRGSLGRTVYWVKHPWSLAVFPHIYSSYKCSFSSVLLTIYFELQTLLWNIHFLKGKIIFKEIWGKSSILNIAFQVRLFPKGICHFTNKKSMQTKSGGWVKKSLQKCVFTGLYLRWN